MRCRSLVGAFVLAAAVFTLLGGESSAQFGGFDMKDPNSMFGIYTQKQGTKDYLLIEKIQSQRYPDLQDKMKAYATTAGIRDGKLTKEQFADFWTKEIVPAMDSRGKDGGGQFGKGSFGKDGGGQFGKGSFGKDGGTSPFGKDGGGAFGKDGKGSEKTAGSEQPRDKGSFGKDGGGFGKEGGFGKGGFGKGGGKDDRPIEERAKEWFSRMDRDRDDVLSEREMSSELREELAKWDTNKNNQIEWDEFLPYAKERIAARDAERQKYIDARAAEEGKNTPGGVNPNGPPMPGTAVVEEKKLVIIRADNLPKEVPAWFKALDTDKDAQIGYYEWKATRDLEDFRKYDRNDDGFITVDEAFWYEKNKDRLAGIIPLTKAPPATTTPATGPGSFSKDKTSATEKDKGPATFGRDSFGKDKGSFGRDMFGKGRDRSKETPKDK